MEESPIPSPTFPSMPPLPQCLKKHLLTENFPEIETNKTLKSLIQPECERVFVQEGTYINAEKYKIVGRPDRYARAETPELESPRDTVNKDLSWKGNIGAAIGHLRKEIRTLRNQDVSLLCQLCTLNESIKEYKSLMQDRMMDSYSECSSMYSMDFTIDESEAENQSFMSKTEPESRSSISRTDSDYRLNRCEPSFRNFSSKMESRVYNYKADVSRSVFARTDSDPRSPFSAKKKPDSFSYTFNKTYSDATISPSSTISSRTDFDSTSRLSVEAEEPMYLEPKSEPMYLEPRSEPFYANINTCPSLPSSSNGGQEYFWQKKIPSSGSVRDEPIYENIVHETSC